MCVRVGGLRGHAGGGGGLDKMAAKTGSGGRHVSTCGASTVALDLSEDVAVELGGVYSGSVLDVGSASRLR